MTAAVVALPRRSATAVRGPREGTPAEGVDLVLEDISPGEVLFSTQVRSVGDPAAARSAEAVSTTMLDFALAAAVQSLLEPGRSYRRVDFAVSTVHPSRPHEGRLEATAQVVRHGCGLVVATGQVRGAGGIRATGRLVAAASAR